MKVTIVLNDGKTLFIEKVDECDIHQGLVFIDRNGRTVGVFEMKNIAGFYTEEE